MYEVLKWCHILKGVILLVREEVNLTEINVAKIFFYAAWSQAWL